MEKINEKLDIIKQALAKVRYFSNDYGISFCGVAVVSEKIKAAENAIVFLESLPHNNILIIKEHIKTIKEALNAIMFRVNDYGMKKYKWKAVKDKITAAEGALASLPGCYANV